MKNLKQFIKAISLQFLPTDYQNYLIIFDQNSLNTALWNCLQILARKRMSSIYRYQTNKYIKQSADSVMFTTRLHPQPKWSYTSTIPHALKAFCLLSAGEAFPLQRKLVRAL
jgi:hypothetical protein